MVSARRGDIHTTRISVAALREIFPGRQMSRFGDIPWPDRSSNHSTSYFFLLSDLKSRIFIDRPPNTAGLKVKPVKDREYYATPAE